MMGSLSRTKGHNFERKIAARLREIYPEAKRGFQTRGGGKEQADVIGVPFHVECKTGKTIDLKAAWKQAARDRGSLPPVVIYHYTGSRETRVRTRLAHLAWICPSMTCPDLLSAIGVCMVDIDFEDFLAILREQEGV